MVSTEVITFRLGSEFVKELKKTVKTNRRWNSRSEIIKTLIELYVNDPTFRKAVHTRVAEKITDKWMDG